MDQFKPYEILYKSIKLCVALATVLILNTCKSETTAITSIQPKNIETHPQVTICGKIYSTLVDGSVYESTGCNISLKNDLLTVLTCAHCMPKFNTLTNEYYLIDENGKVEIIGNIIDVRYFDPTLDNSPYNIYINNIDYESDNFIDIAKINVRLEPNKSNIPLSHLVPFKNNYSPSFSFIGIPANVPIINQGNYLEGVLLHRFVFTTGAMGVHSSGGALIDSNGNQEGVIVANNENKVLVEPITEEIITWLN